MGPGCVRGTCPAAPWRHYWTLPNAPTRRAIRALHSWHRLRSGTESRPAGKLSEGIRVFYQRTDAHWLIARITQIAHGPGLDEDLVHASRPAAVTPRKTALTGRLNRRNHVDNRVRDRGVLHVAMIRDEGIGL